MVVAQATSLENIAILMAPASTTGMTLQGIFMENGSGGFLNGISVVGGKIWLVLKRFI